MRAEAWIEALVKLGVAEVERDAAVRWAAAPGPTLMRCDRVTPRASGALPLVVARTSIDDLEDLGVVLAVANPAVALTCLPLCGCDACDSGSNHELDELDAHIRAVVLGTFRWLWSGKRTITVLDGPGWSSASGFGAEGDRFGRNISGILAKPTGWDEVSGPSWLAT